MATLVYALSGEGRGHATRAQTVIDELRTEHAIKVYGYGQAVDFLAPLYRGTNVEVRKVPGLHFRYTRSGSLDYLRTLIASAPYLVQLKPRLDRLTRELERDAPSLVISDFEPLLPRVADRLGVPFVSLDHQHFLTAYDLRSLPRRLRAYAYGLAPWVHLYYSGQVHSIISSFYEAPLLPRRRNVTRVGVLLRAEVLNAQPALADHLVVYVRRQVPSNVLTALTGLGLPVHVYGLGSQPSRGQVSFHAIDPRRFIEDLATGRALVSTAGNQLVGEALYLGKPVLALPEAGNFEQAINAHFLQASGMGETLPIRALDRGRLRIFLERVDTLRSRIDRASICGNEATLRVLREQLRLAHAGAEDAAGQPLAASPALPRPRPRRRDGSLAAT
ncbi:MAG: glycosyltransferase family protein [Polyangiales bacterium]